MSEGVDVVRARGLEGLPHGFLGRRGGVSGGLYASLNVGLGSKDDPAAVDANRARAVAAACPGATLVTVHQVHSPAVVTVTEPIAPDRRPPADAMVTDRPGLALGVLTADCAPVLLADVTAGVVGAAHSGWGGALGGVCKATVEAMVALGADRARIAAAVGPCIGRRSYEVGPEFRERFAAADESYDAFFTSGGGDRFRFDLEGFVAARLAAAGVTRIETLGLDTFALPDRYFSYRRTTHAREPDYGRQLSLIALPG